jgi:putative mRNA 3-end processing factor
MGLPGDLVQATPEGLWCEAGGFFIDPMGQVDKSVITHAHSDHARSGASAVWCSAQGQGVLRQRIGQEAPLNPLEYGQVVRIGATHVSLHPAGHILGSAQVRIEHEGQVCVVTGDYKTTEDRTCTPFEPVACDHFISECTFGLPVYKWPQAEAVADQIHRWWHRNQQLGRTSLCYAYSLGKAQRVLSLLDAEAGPIGAHGAVHPFLPLYREAGIALPEVHRVNAQTLPLLKGRGLVVAPGSVQGSPWERKLGPLSRAKASGWMAIRGAKRRANLDAGFVLSDHADWAGLLWAIEQTGARRIGLMHGQTAPLVRYLGEVKGLDAYSLRVQRAEPED